MNQQSSDSESAAIGEDALIPIQVVTSAMPSDRSARNQTPATRSEVTTNRAIQDAVLALPYDARVELVEAIVGSLHDDIPPARRAAWIDEAKRRLAAFDRGEMKAIASEEVMDKYRQGSVD